MEKVRRGDVLRPLHRGYKEEENSRVRTGSHCDVSQIRSQTMTTTTTETVTSTLRPLPSARKESVSRFRNKQFRRPPRHSFMNLHDPLSEAAFLSVMKTCGA